MQGGVRTETRVDSKNSKKREPGSTGSLRCTPSFPVPILEPFLGKGMEYLLRHRPVHPRQGRNLVYARTPQGI